MFKTGLKVTDRDAQVQPAMMPAISGDKTRSFSNYMTNVFATANHAHEQEKLSRKRKERQFSQSLVLPKLEQTPQYLAPVALSSLYTSKNSALPNSKKDLTNKGVLYTSRNRISGRYLTSCALPLTQSVKTNQLDLFQLSGK